MTDQQGRPRPRFIVAEVSKSWIDGLEGVPTGPICWQFEQVINTNAARGYRLLQFTLSQTAVRYSERTEMVETIIAVFEQGV